MTPAAGIEPQRLRALIEPRYQQFVHDLESCVNVDCGTFVPEGVNRIADFMQERFEQSGRGNCRHFFGLGGQADEIKIDPADERRAVGIADGTKFLRLETIDDVAVDFRPRPDGVFILRRNQMDSSVSSVCSRPVN